MSTDNSELSLQIILRPASGRLKAKGAVVASNVETVLPSAEGADRVLAYFRHGGFTCGPLVANSFSISGPRSLFVEHFIAADIKRSESTGGELKLTNLPAGIQELLEAAVFTAPPDFGPTSFQ